MPHASRKGALTALLTAFALINGAGASAQSLISFETADQTSSPFVTTTYLRGSYSVSTTVGVTEGVRALRCEFPAVMPESTGTEIRFNYATRISSGGAGSILVDVTNPLSRTVNFGIGLRDHNGQQISGYTSIAAGATRTFAVELQQRQYLPSEFGMGTLPPGYPGMVRINANTNAAFDFTRIAQIRIYMRGRATDDALVVDNFRFRAPFDMFEMLTNVIDRFGQNNKRSFPGKIWSEKSLSNRGVEDLARYSSGSWPAEWSAYGGSLTHPRQTGTGFFRTAYVNGRWWLVTPTGELFFSAGVNSIRPDRANSVIDNREYMYNWLPTDTDPLAKYIGEPYSNGVGLYGGTRAFDFYNANLERKYGSDWLNAWETVTLGRFRDWGFNTIGQGQSRSMRNKNIPYVYSLNTRGGANVNGLFAWSRRGALPDVYDPDWLPVVQERITLAVNTVNTTNSSYCIGFLVDNELPWNGERIVLIGDRDALGIETLTQDAATSPAKAEFLRQLQAKYPTIAALNSAWSTSFASWAAMEGPITVTANTGSSVDLRAFAAAFADRYFKTIHDELALRAPNHLYLGSRFGGSTDEARAAAARHADVVSYNLYSHNITDWQWQNLEAFDRPILFSEFTFGSADWGHFRGGPVSVSRQEERGPSYARYVNAALARNSVVGSHWFCYADDIFSGISGIGDNYNNGLVDIADTEYSLLIPHVRATNRNIYITRP